MALSIRFRQAILLYDLRPTESNLAHLMCLDSYDKGLTIAGLNLRAWSLALGMTDAKGVRTDKCAALVQCLRDLGLCDVHEAKGMFELRPYPNDWSKLRALR